MTLNDGPYSDWLLPEDRRSGSDEDTPDNAVTEMRRHPVLRHCPIFTFVRFCLFFWFFLDKWCIRQLMTYSNYFDCV